MSNEFDNAFFPSGFFPDGFWPVDFWPEPPEALSAVQFIEEALFIILRSNREIDDLIGDHLYPINLPQGQRAEAVVYQQISETEEMTTDGAVGLIEARFQLNCLTSRHEDCLALAAALRNCLNDYEGTIGEVAIAHIRVNDERDIPVLSEEAEQLSRFGRFLDCQVSYSV